MCSDPWWLSFHFSSLSYVLGRKDQPTIGFFENSSYANRLLDFRSSPISAHGDFSRTRFVKPRKTAGCKFTLINECKALTSLHRSHNANYRTLSEMGARIRGQIVDS